MRENLDSFTRWLVKARFTIDFRSVAEFGRVPGLETIIIHLKSYRIIYTCATDSVSSCGVI